jgi:hypothetical protein
VEEERHDTRVRRGDGIDVKKPPERCVLDSTRSAIGSTHRSDATGEMFSTREAATFLGLKESTLRGWRMVGTGPPYYILGANRQRGVRYHKEDLEQFRSERRCVPSVRHIGRRHAAIQEAA